MLPSYLNEVATPPQTSSHPSTITKSKSFTAPRRRAD
jgi:hypothetical protein